MIGAFRSELVKLRTPTYLVGIVGMAAFMAVTMLITVGGAGDEPSDRGPAGLILSRSQLAAADGLGRALGNAAVFLGITTLTLVCINVASEHSSGTIRNLLVRQPRRSRLLLGKILGLLTYLAAGTLTAALVGVAAAYAFAAGNDVETTNWTSFDGLVATTIGLGNLAVAVTGWASIGLLLAILLRSAPAAIGLGVAYALPADILLTETIAGSERWLPGQTFQAIARGGAPWLDHAPALTRSLSWTLILAAAALLIFVRRDVGD